MSGWATAFLAIALAAAILGFVGIAVVSTHVAWTLFICSGVFAAAYFGFERKPSPDARPPLLKR